MLSPPLSSESTLGPYRLVRKLGEGGMGTVYLAFDDQLARHVAIKVLRLDNSQSPTHSTLAKRFLREAQSAARINHPHAVTIHNVGTHAGRPYLVMEFLPNGSLADELRKSGPLPWRTATLAIKDALAGLAAAHNAGVIHRDIKPANLMRSDSHSVKLVDFGLARVVYAPTDSEITYPGSFVGSPSYASPEQAAGGAVVRIDARSDLYSLAATAYALLTGQPPFVDDDPAEIMRLHITAPFPDPRTLTSDIPDELIAILTKASQKDPAARYIGAAEMSAAIENLLNNPGRHGSALRPVPPVLSLSLQSKNSPTPKPIPARAQQSITELESQLALAKSKSDSTTQLSTLRTLYSLYHQLNRKDQAHQAFREALVLHINLSTPRAEFTL